jgi:hypothetical protein
MVGVATDPADFPAIEAQTKDAIALVERPIASSNVPSAPYHCYLVACLRN